MTADAKYLVSTLVAIDVVATWLGVWSVRASQYTHATQAYLSAVRERLVCRFHSAEHALLLE